MAMMTSAINAIKGFAGASTLKRMGSYAMKGGKGSLGRIDALGSGWLTAKDMSKYSTLRRGATAAGRIGAVGVGAYAAGSTMMNHPLATAGGLAAGAAAYMSRGRIAASGIAGRAMNAMGRFTGRMESGIKQSRGGMMATSNHVMDQMMDPGSRLMR